MNFCLSDLVPPLRWSDASTITLLTGQPDLPDAWWRTLPMPRVLAAIGPEALGELLTEIALEQWPAAAVGDILPALHVLDPDEADEPHVAIALDRAGSWVGLLALTGRELADQPFIQARPVLATLFCAVFARLAPMPSRAENGRADAARSLVNASAVPGVPVWEAARLRSAAEAVRDEAVRDEAVRDEAAEREEPAERVAEQEEPAEETPADQEAADQEPAEGVAAEGVAAEGVAADDEPADDVAAEQEGAAAAEAVPQAVPQAGAEAAEEPAEDTAAARSEPAVDDAAEDANEDANEDAVGAGHEPAAEGSEEEPADRPEDGVQGAVEEMPDVDETGDEKTDGEKTGGEKTGGEKTGGEKTGEPGDEELDAQGQVAEESAPGEHATQDEDEPVREPAVVGSPDLSGLIEAAFAGLDDKSWAVAQNRIFTDQPSAVDQLAKLFAVPTAEIDETEVRLRARLDNWLASQEAAPYRAHLDELRRVIGPSAPKERLIKAADWHLKEIRALEVPAWQFVLATLPTRSGESALPAGGPPPAGNAFSAASPSPAKGMPPSAFAPPPEPLPKRIPFPPRLAAEQAAGSRFQAFTPAVPPSREAVPPTREAMPPAREPMPLASEAMPPSREAAPAREAAPPVREEENGVSEDGLGKPYQPLKDVSQTRRCFRQPDGRWWLRVDVTAAQIAGGECPLPTGFAAYLGLSPGETRTVRSAAGELTLTWHGRPVLESVQRLLEDVGAQEGGHLFLTLSDEGVLRARHLPVAAPGAETITKALRLVGYTAPGGTREQAARVIATRIGMAGPVGLPELLAKLRERGDRDLLGLLD